MADPAETPDGNEPEDDTPRGLRAKIEEQAKGRREAETKAQELQRENLLLKSGLNLNERQQRALFADIGEGDLTVEALKAAAQDLFGAAPATGTPQTEQPPPTANDVGQMEEFAKGGSSVEPPPDAVQAFNDAVNNWQGSREELMEFIFARNQGLLQS